jgi:16S rRNA (cytidine1402-2'-O)-methyltransferase
MSETIQAGVLYVVSTPIGNLEDISFRAVRVLKSVDLIAAEDTRTTRFLLQHFSIARPVLSYYSYNEGRRLPELIRKLQAGISIALVSEAGTPGISDPAYLLIRKAVEEQIRVIPIPGASAVLAALVASGLPTDRFVFEGFLPVKKGRTRRLEVLKREERTIVLYESPFRIEQTVADILQHVGNRRISIVREVTKKFEEVLRGSAGEVLDMLRKRPVRGEIVLVMEGASGKEVPPALHGGGS